MNYAKITTRIGAVVAGTAAALAGVGVAVPAAEAAGPTTTGTVNTRAGLTVRTAPTIHSAKAGVYNSGATVKLYCGVAGGPAKGFRAWYSTNASGTRWVKADFIDAKKKVKRCPVADTERSLGVATAQVNLRKGPSTSDQISYSKSKGSKIETICKVRAQRIDGNNLWYYTSDENWVSARYVKNVDGGPASNLTPVWCN